MLLTNKVEVAYGCGGASKGSSRSAAMTSARAAALTTTLGLAAASWVVAVRQMNGMDMGVATRLGSFASFVGLWVSMPDSEDLEKRALENKSEPETIRPLHFRRRALPLARFRHRSTDASRALLRDPAEAVH